MIMELIQPSHFDAVVITSGLPEVLIASALARAGKSVLLLDEFDSYGASWGSIAGDAFAHTLVIRQISNQSNTSAVPDHAHTQLQQCEPSSVPAPLNEQSTAAATSASSDAAVGIQSAPPLAQASSCSMYTHPSLDVALGNKQLVIDLAPKVLYQDEPLVQLLVSCQAHNYLEFKLVEGSYIYQSGQLRPVPASRAELFADKSLSLHDKRSLGRFLSACVEAQQRLGRLKDTFDSRPLVDLLAAEGLSEQLQQMVLYGIAMADVPQQQARQQRTQPPQQQLIQQQVGDQGQKQPAANSSNDSSGANMSDGLTAAAGLAALQLYNSSLGRYGGSGAFMAPCYGCGSLPEAFVRLAAVKGATTALRHRAQWLVSARQQQCSSAEPECASTDAVQQQLQAGETASAVAPPTAAATGAAGSVQVRLASGQTITTNHAIGCKESIKQADSSASSGCAEPTAAHSSGRPVACAVAILDGSLVDGDGSLLLVFPPGSLGPQQTVVIRGLQLGPAFSVTPPGRYVLYLSAMLPEASSGGGSSNSGPGADTSAPVPAAAAACSPEGILGHALAAVASARGLAAVQAQRNEGHEPNTASSSEEASHAGDGTASTHTGTKLYQLTSVQQPQVLAACYYMVTQPCQHFASLSEHWQCLQQHKQCNCKQQFDSSIKHWQQHGLGSVLLSPAAPRGLVGYTAMVKAAEAAYRQQFPGLPWLTDNLPAKQTAPASSVATAAQEKGNEDRAASAAGSSEGAHAVAAGCDADAPADAAADGAGGGVLDEAELDAIDELTAALMELTASPGAQAEQVS